MRDPAAIRAFLDRDWASAARDKELYWRDYKRKHGPAAGIRIADELRRQVLAARPDWPSERERAEDLATHLRVIEVLRRVPARSRKLEPGDVEVPVMSAEDRIVVKVLSGRPKDLEDVRGVLVEQAGRLDLARVRDVLGAMEAVIGKAMLLPRLERLVRSASGGGATVRRRKAPR
jgi:hypothetical protein